MDVRIEPTEDADLINAVIRHPKVWPMVSDDFATDPAEFDATPAIGIGVMQFCRAVVNEQTAGVFMLQRHNGVMYEVHTCILPEFYGDAALKCANALIAFAFISTPCRKLITLVPEYNRLALRFAKRAGMAVQGVITKSYLKNGQLHDQCMLGICKE